MGFPFKYWFDKVRRFRTVREDGGDVVESFRNSFEVFGKPSSMEVKTTDAGSNELDSFFTDECSEDLWSRGNDEFDKPPFFEFEHTFDEYTIGGSSYISVSVTVGMTFMTPLSKVLGYLQEHSDEIFNGASVSMIGVTTDADGYSLVFAKVDSEPSTPYDFKSVYRNKTEEALTGILSEWVLEGVYEKHGILPKVRLKDGFMAQPKFSKDENKDAYIHFNKLRRLFSGVHIDRLNEELFKHGVQLVRSGGYVSKGSEYNTLKTAGVDELGIQEPIKYFDSNYEVE